MKDALTGVTHRDVTKVRRRKTDDAPDIDRMAEGVGSDYATLLEYNRAIRHARSVGKCIRMFNRATILEAARAIDEGYDDAYRRETK